MPPDALLLVRNLSKTYSAGGRLVRALDSVSFAVPTRATVAVVGSSGSGKSTLARCLARREEASGGTILFDGRDVTALRGRPLRQWRRSVQLLPQDPGMSLNPRLPAAHAVSEPLRILRLGTPAQQRDAALELLRVVGLPEASAFRLPAQFSGGQRARLALARALAAAPRFLILDESLSALDLSTRASILDLLRHLQQRRSLAYLVITHDLGLAAAIAAEILVMHDGRIVESGPASHLLEHPSHPQTQSLLAAVPGRA